MKIKSFGLLLLIVLLLSACGTESKGKKVVEKYLDEVKKGESTFDYITFDVDGLRDVFEYEYLSVEQLDDEKNLSVYTRSIWESSPRGFATFDDYKLDKKETWSRHEVISDTENELVLWQEDDYLEVFKYLYNVTITDRDGQKLYKKIEFEVQKEEENDPMIRDIYIR